MTLYATPPGLNKFLSISFMLRDVQVKEIKLMESKELSLRRSLIWLVGLRLVGHQDFDLGMAEWFKNGGWVVKGFEA